MSNTDTLFFNVQQKTDKQHILDNPDTYIGSVETIDSDMWVFDDTNNKIIEKNICYIPGLFKLFDEGIVNCRDHVIRMQTNIDNNINNSLPVTYIDITIEDDGTIIMTNDGNGMDVAQHPENNIWIPELIFAHLRTSTNYDKEEKKIVGGKNGFGFKLVLIWSSYGSIETVDHIRGLKYTQEYHNNLDTICPPKITKATKSKPYTKITFKPDYQRLGINNLSADVISLLKKRVFDISAITDKKIKVRYNTSLIPIKNFEQYINLYIGDKTESLRVHEQVNERWEYAVALTPTKEFIQISFVNGIYTSKGGKHVEYILNQITRKMSEFIEKKKKIKVNPNAIKEQLMLFIRCDIENPAFDSQTKDYMNTPMTKFGSKCEVSDKFIEKIAKMGIMEAACAITEIKENKAIKKTDGKKSKTIQGIPHFDDANYAGTDKSKDCTCLLCEGKSAHAALISGLSSNDRNYLGVYSLKGKLLNVRNNTKKKISENKEINEIKKILGLETGKIYNTIEDVYKDLRYGKLIFVTDQDLDGTHIIALCANLFNWEWKSLTYIPGFIGFMNTPLVKAFKGKNQKLEFYNEGEYNLWKQQVEDIKKWTFKYYKGLGTSTKSEFINYLKQKKFVGFNHNGEISDDAIDMVFNNKRANDRKDWLKTKYDKNNYIDTSKLIISYEDFINKGLIHYSKYDCDRSIPNIMDGLKTSLRKILFCAFKKNLKSEIKVAQLAGYVSENSEYRHGEESLNKAIVGMAQNFMGSNNINVLSPIGQFGSRIEGGNDSASPRYIYTKLEKITRFIYSQEDDNILNYFVEDGMSIEPSFYIPIVPMILVNGTVGIGTGFSSSVLSYNLIEIIQYLQNKLTGKTDNIKLFPYYEGFTGTIQEIQQKEVTKYLIKGKYEKLGVDTIRVTELPIGFWTADFLTLIDTLRADKNSEGVKITPIVKDLIKNHTDTTIDFTITFTNNKLNELEQTILEHNCNGLEKLLQLYTTVSTTNMYLFDHNDKLTKYESVEEIIEDYYFIRIQYYEDRKIHKIDSIEKVCKILSNKVKYIEEQLNNTIDLRKKSKAEISKMLVDKYYDVIDDDLSFSYLVRMEQIDVCQENVNSLLKSYKEKEEELNYAKTTTIEQMWLLELETLKNQYEGYILNRIEQQKDDKDKINTEKAGPEKKTKNKKTKLQVVN
jgi:DNA topoisomerase-2